MRINYEPLSLISYIILSYWKKLEKIPKILYLLIKYNKKVFNTNLKNKIRIFPIPIFGPKITRQ